MRVVYEIDRIFKRKDLFNSLDEIRRVSEKSGIINMDELKVSINPVDDLWMTIEPYKGTEDFELLNNWKNTIDGIYVGLPAKEKTRKKVNKIYGKSIGVLEKSDTLFDLSFKPLSINPYSWENYSLNILGGTPCKYKDKYIIKALKNPNIYNSKTCSKCLDEVRNYCKDITSILNKYSTPIPENIRIKNYKNKK